MLYRLDCAAADVAARFGAQLGDDPWRGDHVAPGQFAPIITAGREAIAGPRAECRPRRMVPPPPAARGARQGVLSVRNLESPFWIGNLRYNEFRCLVPATSFMEWGRIARPDRRRVRLAANLSFARSGVAAIDVQQRA